MSLKIGVRVHGPTIIDEGKIKAREVFGKKVLTFEGVSRESLEGLGEVRTPDIADLFVAKVKGAAA